LNIFSFAEVNDLFWTRDLNGIYWICRVKEVAKVYLNKKLDIGAVLPVEAYAFGLEVPGQLKASFNRPKGGITEKLKDINIIEYSKFVFNKLSNEEYYDVNLNEFIHILIDFLLLKDDLGDKWSEYRKKIANSKLTLGKVKGDDFSGEVIMRILGEFSKIQRDNLFKLILMSKEGINLNEIALIEDALKEYISLDSKLIIKQLTKDFFNDEVRYILLSK
ncbi:MAG: hypothetical protein E7C60_12000, partial [Clostridium perfringens]|nr:hypothetical protein [Clostridium perfringens]